MTRSHTCTMNGYWRHLMDTRTEVAIWIAGVLLLMAVADPLFLKAAKAFAPGLLDRALALDPTLRRWAIGLPPSILLLTTIIGRDLRQFKASRSCEKDLLQ